MMRRNLRLRARSRVVAVFGAAAVSISLAIGICAVSQISIFAADNTPQKIVAFAPEQVQWFTPSYYTDGRQRAQLIGDSSKPGPFVDRAKIPSGGRARAHTHPDTAMITVIAGTWYVGMGDKFDAAKLQPYPAGSFVVIPAGVPHFVAAPEGEVVVQISGDGPFRTEFLEK
jgi:quercetin dioxygenase-like cupin family protein